ncbi:MAG: hypothetical protein HOP28_09350 [Gemmatimonadales bacterium]|nr:hypothetical protein [Gemmatimonadales bacterium]
MEVIPTSRGPRAVPEAVLARRFELLSTGETLLEAFAKDPDGVATKVASEAEAAEAARIAALPPDERAQLPAPLDSVAREGLRAELEAHQAMLAEASKPIPPVPPKKSSKGTGTTDKREG